jgi:hypothetical protein
MDTDQTYPAPAMQPHTPAEPLIRQMNGTATRLESSADQGGKNLIDLHIKLIDIAQKNTAASFEFGKKLLAVKSMSEAMELQSAYMKSQIVAATQQAEDVREAWLSALAGVLQPMQRNAIEMFQRARVC